MRILSVVVVLSVITLASACGKGETRPAKLKKIDFKVTVDDRGRVLPEIELFDEKHGPFVVVGGSYTLTVATPDDTVLCSVTHALVEADYNATKRLASAWQDASCPPAPAIDELRITLEVTGGGATITRTKPIPTKFVYAQVATTRAVAEPPPAAKQAPAAPPTDASASMSETRAVEAEAMDMEALCEQSIELMTSMARIVEANRDNCAAMGDALERWAADHKDVIAQRQRLSAHPSKGEKRELEKAFDAECRPKLTEAMANMIMPALGNAAACKENGKVSEVLDSLNERAR